MSFFKLGTTKPTVGVTEKFIPKILFRPEALIQMQLYIENCAEEVGWLGTAVKQDGVIIIDEMLLFEQEVHATTTEITPEGLSKYAEELLSQPDGLEKWNKIKLWGHSHVNMGVTPSGQDNDQMKTFADCGHDFFIRIIGNKSGAMKLDFYDFVTGVIYYDVPWDELVNPEEEAILAEMERLETLLNEFTKKRKAQFAEVIKKEVEQKVKKKVYVTTTYPTNQAGFRSGYYTAGEVITIKDPGNDKKNTANVTEKEKETKNGNLITKNKDVWEYFTYDDLLEIGEARTLKEAEELVKSKSMTHLTFTAHDVRFVWDFSEKLWNSYVQARGKR